MLFKNLILILLRKSVLKSFVSFLDLYILLENLIQSILVLLASILVFFTIIKKIQTRLIQSIRLILRLDSTIHS